MKKYVALLATALLLAALLSLPSYALNVYGNPSIQSNNVSPDGTYNEANSMQIVSDKFIAKCAARGFATRDSNWLSMASACTDAVNWGADAFVAIHTNATGSGGWNATRGTMGIYYQSNTGSYDANDRDLCVKCVDNCISQFSLSGRGAKWGNGYYGDWSFYGYHLYVLANTPGMNSVLIEGLFHTNYDDTQLLKTDTGKNEYAEGLYRGVCDHYGYTYGTLNSAFNAQSYTGNLAPGQNAVCWVEYQNNGGETWYSSGANPVRLGTWNPQDRSSVFYTAGNWIGPTRPTTIDTGSVAPGGVGRFTFIMTRPAGDYNTYTEYWRLVAESKAWFGYDGVWFRMSTTPNDIVVDNSAAGFSASANWITYSSSAQKYGADYKGRTTAAVSDAANWAVNVPTAGNYDVYVWYPAGTNRPTAAPYIVYYNGGNQTVNVNQQINGGQWNLLGRWNFAAGSNNVKLSCWTTAGSTIIADAVRMVGPY